MVAITNQRPDLFQSIIADVPFVDITNTMLDPNLSAVVSEYEEWGNPQIKEQFEYILSYDPYQNVTAKDYPNILAIAGFYDTRVNYWEPAKWVAKLRANKTDDNLIEINKLLESDLIYNWVNYSVLVGIDYFLTNNSSNLVSNSVSDNQVLYDIVLYKSGKFSLEKF